MTNREQNIDNLNHELNLGWTREKAGGNYETLVMRDAALEYAAALRDEREARGMEPADEREDYEYASQYLYAGVEGDADLPHSIEELKNFAACDIDNEEE